MKRAGSPRAGRRLLASLAAAAIVGGAAADGASGSQRAVYTQTNDPAGNVVVALDRAPDGSLSPAVGYPTGGVGLAALGGRQGAVELSDDGQFVYAVNAGSDTVTALRVTHDGLRVVDTVSSGGSAPISVDEQRGRLYVLNSGATPNVTAFASVRRGRLAAIPGGTRELPGALGVAQVAVAPHGTHLVVSERLSNRLEALALDVAGRPGVPVITPSSGTVPFGFAFGARNDVIVSEAGLSTVSSYRLAPSGTLGLITPSLAVGQGAACWIAVDPDGRLAYTGNASGSISGFSVGRDGTLTALDADGLTAVPAQTPRDLDFARHGRLLYAVSPGTPETGGLVTAYAVARDGALTTIDAEVTPAGITGAAAG